METGDLAYIPSGAILFQMHERNPVKWEELEYPMSLLVCGDTDQHYKVLYRGSIWHALKSAMTLIQKGTK